MHAVAFSLPRTSEQVHLLHLHHQLRARVFSDRLGWEVDVTEGCEIDRFDKLRPTYVLAIAESGALAGSARLLPALGPTMVADIFPSLLYDGQLHSHAAMIESSRFCVDTALADGRSDGFIHEATSTMFAGIIEWCLANDYSEVVTVTDLRFERILRRVGWPLHRLGEPKRIGVTMALAGTLPANREAFLRLRPSGYQSDLGSSR